MTQNDRLSSQRSDRRFSAAGKICSQTVSDNRKPMHSQIDEAENRRRSDSLCIVF